MNKQYLVKKPADFKEIVEDILLAHSTSENMNLVITLEGDLGAGKTTFTQELAKEIGVHEVVTSPTFTIMKQYSVSATFAQLVHIDAYRIESEAETGPLQLESVFKKPNTIVCIEWPSHISNIIPNTAVKIAISIIEGEDRKVVVSSV